MLLIRNAFKTVWWKTFHLSHSKQRHTHTQKNIFALRKALGSALVNE